MAPITVKLPDDSTLELEDGATGADAAAAIGPRLAKDALAVRVNGEVRDLAAPLDDGERVEIVTPGRPDALDVLRHDTAHVLATAVLELYPGTKVSIGPPIADGFYYDFEFPDGVTVNEGDFERIEAQMRKHVKADEPFECSEVTTAEAIDRYLREDQPYKVELIEDLVRDQGITHVSLYKNGDFLDLCRGPHAPSTGRAKAFKLTSVAGAYWRGDAKRQMLTRIYGTAFATKDELAQHLERLEQARARDHRRLGRELGLFAFSETATGSAFWLPHGTQLFNTLVQVSRSMGDERGYTEVKTPQLYDSQLWKTSGHWDKYRENMFVTESEDRQLALKPMNCPGHCQLFKLQRFSYRDLPVRYSEPGLLHRNELSGTLHGLLRVRHFVQDDAHIFCTEDQVQDEVAAALKFAFDPSALFGLSVALELSTRPDVRIGTDEMWDHSEAALRGALESHGLPYTV